jgi:hypothetical protein
VGTDTARAVGTANLNIQSEGTGAESGISLTRNVNSTASSNLRFVKTRGATVGSSTIVQSGDDLGAIGWWGTDGTNAVEAAGIIAEVDGTPGTNDMPGRLVFSTTADGASSATERLRIDSSGKVGIGTTSPSTLLHLSSATGSATPTPTELRIATTTGASDWSTTDPWGRISFYNADGSGGGSRIHGAIDVTATNTGGGASGMEFKINDTVTAGALIKTLAFVPSGTNSTETVFYSGNASERLRIDSSGRLLVGTSTARANFYNSTISPQIQLEATGSGSGRFLSVVNNSATNTNPAGIILGKTRGSAVGGTTVVQSGDWISNVSFQASDGTEFVEAASIDCYVDGTPGANDMPGRLVFSTTADGASNPTEQMRITSDGRVLFGTTGTPSASVTGAAFTPQTNGRMSLFSSTSSTATQKHVLFFNPNGEVGSISTNASATAYTTSSDYRLKENIVPLTGASERVLQLKPSRFNFIADPDIQVDGFIAHEAQKVVPECVTGTKDEVDEDGKPVYQGIDQSKLVPLLTAALQEALQKIEDLKARLTEAGI